MNFLKCMYFQDRVIFLYSNNQSTYSRGVTTRKYTSRVANKLGIEFPNRPARLVRENSKRLAISYKDNDISDNDTDKTAHMHWFICVLLFA